MSDDTVRRVGIVVISRYAKRGWVVSPPPLVLRFRFAQ